MSSRYSSFDNKKKIFNPLLSQQFIEKQFFKSVTKNVGPGPGTYRSSNFDLFEKIKKTNLDRVNVDDTPKK